MIHSTMKNLTKKILDISWPLEAGITTYKNRNDFSMTDTKNWDEHRYRESLITIGSHTGTHIDAPAHFLEAGSTIQGVSLESLIGPCSVLDVSDVTDGITREHLEKKTLTRSRILLKTKNSAHTPSDPFDASFIYLAASGAAYLQEKGIVCVGIDYIGIERNQPDYATHTTLLKNNIALIEGLRLALVPEGDYYLVCLPLALSQLEAAPARAVLIAGETL